MRTIANALILGAASAGAVFDKLHEAIDSAERILDAAEPLFAEVREDLHDLGDVVHEKAAIYSSLFDEVKHTVADVRGTVVNSSINKSELGCTVEETVYDNMFSHTVITAPEYAYEHDYEQQAAHMLSMAKFHKELRESNANPIKWTCDNREPDGTPYSIMSELPALAADLSVANPTATYKGHCFQEITFKYEKVSETQFDVTVNLQHPTGPFCTDTLFFANTEIAHPQVFYKHGDHKLTFNVPTKDGQIDVDFGGIHAYAFCEGLIPTIGAIWNTFKSMFGGCELGPCKPNLPFFGKKVPKYMEEATVNFLE